MNAIVTTTINPPTEALRKFAVMKGWQLVIVCDKKTPIDDRIENALYLTCEFQDKFAKRLSTLIGWNCIQRRNLGLLFAVKELRAEVIATVDDDNIPHDGWGRDLVVGKIAETRLFITSQPAADPIYAVSSSYDANPLWHRGFPLELLSGRNGTWGLHTLRAHVQADFWNGDPDIDAVCRMTRNTENTRFGNFAPFTANAPSPFNSQNTFLLPEVIPSYFMHLDVGRWDDILASYHAQSLGFNVVYCEPSVTQKRNSHDLIEDFRRETWGTSNAVRIIGRLKENPDAIHEFLTPRASSAFKEYQSSF